MSDEREPTYWFVGASVGGSQDKTDELVRNGEWRIWPDSVKPDLHQDKVLSMRPDDKIAIKSSFVRKRDLPFDNRGIPVSVMAIKAIGTITENPGNGQSVKVDWEKRYDPPREWYFYTIRSRVWKPKSEISWYARALIRFAFEEEEQDIDAFRNEPFWRDRYGDTSQTDTRFAWTAFYQSFASQLLKFKNRRMDLLAGLRRLKESGQVSNLGFLQEKDTQGSAAFIDDICPFTVMATFNRGLTDENRQNIAAALANIIGVDNPVPEGFEGIPVVNNQKSRFFVRKDERGSEDIERLWEVFEAALTYADAEETNEITRQNLASLYDEVVRQKGIGWTLSVGLYWARPWDFLPLDQNTRNYLREVGLANLPSNQYTKLSGEDYLKLVEDLKTHFEEEDEIPPVQSFPGISFRAWSGDYDPDEAKKRQVEYQKREESTQEAPETYTINDILEEGSFFPKEELIHILSRLEDKKNIILQGPPGTGKTWLSKKLAYASIGKRTSSQLIPLQFHPTLSYEDFVRGWRPSAEGKLELVDGPLMQAISLARDNPNTRYVVVIEEINRGNPAQILGEMLTLLEGDKRTPESAMRLSHMHKDESHIYVPRNLFVIGTMNIADRSLALMDLALRRRFAFIDLEPKFNELWGRWVMQRNGFNEELIQSIRERMNRLNDTITSDETLGPQFQVGHSYVTPPARVGASSDPRQWFIDVVKTEIAPLLEEYWFDRPEKAQDQKKQLLQGL